MTATTEPNWSSDSDPIRILLVGLSRRPVKSPATANGKRMPMPRKNNGKVFHMFWELNGPTR
ncbi:hypothetical protein GCM10009611_18820 [Arthrobacter roseus]